jgi:hypothetical protein
MQLAHRGPENRAAARHNVMLQGKIVAPKQPIYCAVLDLSRTGARLQLGSEVPLPARFELQIGRVGRSLWVEQKWRRESWIGVAFEQPIEESELLSALPRKPLQPRRTTAWR